MHVHRTFKPLLLSAVITSALLAACSAPSDSTSPAPVANTESATDVKSAMSYPSFAKMDVSDKYGDVSVADPFRGLEEIDSDATKAWIAEQNKLTESVLEKLSLRTTLQARMTELWNFERFSVPFSEGGRWFISRNDGLQNQSVLYTMERPDAEPKLLLDPNTFSSDGTKALNNLSVSPNGKYLAYAVSSGGSDWQEWRIRNIETGEDLSDVIEWSKFSTANWAPDNSGFYFGAFDKPEGENALKAANKFQKVYFHTLGQAENKLIYEQPSEPEQSADFNITDDGKYIVNIINRGTDERNLVHIRKTDQNGGGEWIKLIDKLESAYNFVGNIDRTFYFLTTNSAPKYRLIAINLDKPAAANWQTIIPESDATLTGVSLVGDSFIARYLRNARSGIAPMISSN